MAATETMGSAKALQAIAKTLVWLGVPDDCDDDGKWQRSVEMTVGGVRVIGIERKP